MADSRPPPSFKIAREVLSAGAGASIADSIFNPMEVIKVKLQLQGQVGQGKPYYSGVLAAAQKILAEDGLYLLWTPGLVATWIRGLSYTGGVHHSQF
jgi:solute carrier family 25 uncoupling protein 8/9